MLLSDTVQSHTKKRVVATLPRRSQFTQHPQKEDGTAFTSLVLSCSLLLTVLSGPKTNPSMARSERGFRSSERPRACRGVWGCGVPELLFFSLDLLLPSQGEVIAILILHILGDPEDDAGEADEGVGDDVLDAHLGSGPGDAGDDEAEDEDDDAAGHAAGEGGEAEE